MQTSTPADLAPLWIKAKAEEDAARAKRLDIESAICARLSVPPGANQTIQIIPGLRVVYDVRRSVDTDALRAAWDTLPAVAQNCIRWKAEVSAKDFSAASDLVPEAVAALNAFITTKDAKPSFSLAPAKAIFIEGNHHGV